MAVGSIAPQSSPLRRFVSGLSPALAARALFAPFATVGVRIAATRQPNAHIGSVLQVECFQSSAARIEGLPLACRPAGSMVAGELRPAEAQNWWIQAARIVLYYSKFAGDGRGWHGKKGHLARFLTLFARGRCQTQNTKYGQGQYRAPICSGSKGSFHPNLRVLGSGSRECSEGHCDFAMRFARLCWRLCREAVNARKGTVTSTYFFNVFITFPRREAVNARKGTVTPLT